MGTNIKNVIEINGKRYDAATGAPLGGSARAVDGFSRHPSSRQPAVALAAPRIVTPTAAPIAVVAKPVMDIRRTSHAQAPHAKPHTPQRPQTLMRSAVKKPVIKSPQHLKAQTRTDILSKAPTISVVPKVSLYSVDPARVKRAERIAQSKFVTRYGSVTAPSAIKLPTTPAPRPETAKPVHVPHVAAKAVEHKQAAHHDIFEKALAEATSHERTYDHRKQGSKKRSRTASFATASLAALLLIAFITYQNIPNLTMRVASSRAGFHASLPGYTPSGFALGHFSYSPGTVAINYHSNSDDRQYAVTQKVSSWDSQALLQNVVASSDKTYQSFSAAGRTIYVYGQNTATWVSDGVWYTVSGNGSLTTTQLLNLASSM